MNKAILVILDGWGIRNSSKCNAVKLAKTPVFDRLWKQNSHTELKAAEQAVGLPKGYMGNSEVGHQNLGAGRLVKQEVTMINDSIKNNSFFKNKAFISAIQRIKKRKARLHLMGLLSDSGVHSHTSHLFALMKLARKYKVPVLIHVFADGRDTPKKSALKYLRQLKKNMKDEKIATVIGRFYAMDRDNRLQRTKKAYQAIMGKGLQAKTAEQAIKQSYAKGETDEFIKPTVLSGYDGVKKGDGFIFYNFREDRARQITKLLSRYDFTCMHEYDKRLKLPVAFVNQKVKNVLSEVLSKNKARQFHIAETEKYAHVTYFFNSGVEKPFKGESRKIIPSPKVSTYDKTPEMHAAKICKEVVGKMHKYDFIVVNFANPDMVGHTGNLKAAIKAVSFTDACLGKIVKKAQELGVACVITADHGNCEEMAGKYETSHTLNKVPLIVVGKKCKLRTGALGNVAPTILQLMGIKKPREMSGSLF